MNDHSELIVEAQELADKLCPIKGVPFPHGRPGGTLKYSPPSSDTLAAAATAICTLADIVEAYDKAESEAVAACRTGDEVLTELINIEAPTSNADIGPQRRRRWTNVHGLKRLMQRAVEMADKEKGGA